MVIKKGRVGVFKLVNQGLACNADLDSDRANRSVVCGLQPNERLNVDLDFVTMKNAHGTYQVEMSKV